MKRNDAWRRLAVYFLALISAAFVLWVVLAGRS